MSAHRFLFLIILATIPSLLPAEDDRVLTITLAETRARAENNSSELEALLLQNQAQEYAWRLGIRSFFPTLSIGFNQSDAVTMLAPGDSTRKTVSFTLHQPLFDGGRALFQRQVQKIDLTLQQYAFVKKREELLDQAWSLFHRLLLSREKRRLQDELYAIARQQLVISQKEREVGAATEIDFIDTALQVKKMEAEMKKTGTDEEVLVYQFLMLCGLPRSQAIDLNGKIDFTYRGLDLPPLTDFWLAMALERNMEYRQMAYGAARTREEFKIAQTTWIPTVGADFTFSLSGQGLPLYEPGFSFKLTFQFPFNEAPTRLGATAGAASTNQRTMTTDASADVLPSLTFLSDRKLALLKIRMTDLQVDGAEENLRFSIEQFLKNYSAATENLSLQKETIELLNRKQRVTKEQLGIGEIKRIDYLKAQNEYYQQAIAIRESILAILQLERGFEQLLGLEAGELTRLVEAERNANTRQQEVTP
jgi:outer membrane protein TolC